jgi:hypothetical protein
LAGLVVDTNGDAFVSVRDLAASNNNWVTFKFSGSTGSVLWGPVVYDRAGTSDLPTGIGLLPGGDVVVTGFATAPSQHEIAVIRYSGATGAVVWGPTFISGVSGTSAEPTELATDSSGNLFVTGYSYDPLDPTSVDVVVVKLLGGTGAPAWGPFYIDAGLNDYGVSIALMGSGDPVVAAWSRDRRIPAQDAVLLLSWESSTGTLRWGPVRYETNLGESPNWVGVGANTIYVAADYELNGSRPEFFNPPTTLVLAYVETLGIATPSEDLFATCGTPLSIPLEAANVNGTATWSAVGEPPGVTVSPSGLLYGTPTQVGEFLMSVQVQDSSLATASRDLTIVVREDGMVPIVATPVDDCTWMLSVPGSWTSHAWEPSDETTSTITVSPLNDTIYGVTVDDGSGCTVRGSVLIRATRLIDPDCDAPGLTAISPTSGQAAGGTLVTLSGSQFEAGTQTRVDAIPVSTSFQDASTLTITTPPLDPGTLNNVLVVNPNFSTAMLPNAFFADFSDVDQLHSFHDFVEALVRAQVTAGCGGGNYCPDDAATREQMAVFLLRSKEGPSYSPPACVTPTFNDVPCTSPFAPWINELVARSVTAGCGGGNYCPNDPVTREQMAVFLLRTFEGPTYTPPACVTPTFTDVPCSSPFARWIEELVARGITAGCGGGLYCPLQAVSRGQMAVLLTATFGL